jgi:hypothetical protein
MDALASSATPQQAQYVVAVVGLIAVALVAMVAFWQYTRSMSRLIESRQTLPPPGPDLGKLIGDVLDRFVEQSKSTNETITGVYAPAAGAGSADPIERAVASAIEAMESQPQMMTWGDFDDTDPTDEYLKPERAGAAFIGDGDTSPFGVPGLTHTKPSYAPFQHPGLRELHAVDL